MVFRSYTDQTRQKQPRNKGVLSNLVQIGPKPGNGIGGKIGGKTLPKDSVIFCVFLVQEFHGNHIPFLLQLLNWQPLN